MKKKRRESLDDEKPAASLKKKKKRRGVEFFSSGCTLLDCVLGGGWAKGRNSNIVGDSSTGKTHLAIEAAANYAMAYPDDLILYRDPESAFEEGYAESVGMPMDRVDFGKGRIYVIEEFKRDIEEFADLCIRKRVGGLYVLDSLDALSDMKEIAREEGKGSYGTEKAKQMSEMFRKINQKLSKAGVTVIIISQVRDKIGVMFGRKVFRAGGKALKFFCSQVIWLTDKGKIKKTRNNITRAVGHRIGVLCDKNKVALPFRECDFSIMFGYGIDDLGACLTFLKETGIKEIQVNGKLKKIDSVAKAALKLSDDDYFRLGKEVAALTRERWRKVDRGFAPTRSKYGNKPKEE